MKNRFLSIVLLCCGISAPLHSQSDPVQKQPNILVFIVDQMIPMFSGPYGSEAAMTPNLVLTFFDPEEIDREAQLSFERRRIIHESRKVADPPKWDYRPVEDIHHMYWR